jgi:hypothetical protein
MPTAVKSKPKPEFIGLDMASGPDINVEIVHISKVEYDDLLAESRMLAALMAAGVDQWSGYDEARESLGLTESVDRPF